MPGPLPELNTPGGAPRRPRGSPRLWLGLGLGLALLLAVWFGRGSGPEPTLPLLQAPDERLVSLYIRDYQVAFTAADGRLARTLSGALFTQLAADGSAEIEAPRFILHNPAAPSWHARAAQGLLSADGERLQLRGGVVIERAADARHPPLRVETDSLELRHRESYARTDSRVVLTRGADRMEAVGLEAWLQPPMRLKLLSRVRGRYEP